MRRRPGKYNRPKIRRRSLTGHCQSPPYSYARSVGHINNLPRKLGNGNELMIECPPGTTSAGGGGGGGGWVSDTGECVDIELWLA